ncbi:MAG: HD domain-containing protein [Desulfovibrio sp.]|nr:HD domain-containing protein [Desulfovibrio sp.]
MTQGIRRSLLQFIFSGAFLLRWNDKLRPTELMEIDKQAHKMLIACILWHTQAEHLDSKTQIALARDIIEGGLFDYFYRLIITDIKPPVFYRIKENRADYEQLTEYVLSKLHPFFAPPSSADTQSFWERMCVWHRSTETDTPARRILNAAHLFASHWEFSLIRPLNFFDDEMDEIESSFQKDLERFVDLPAMSSIRAPKTALGRLASLAGQLRFQIRWTRIPRIPLTAVLGHMFLVAVFSYLYSLSIQACQARCNNNFFCGLFHDLPEVLTRDIISPVKSSVPNLPSIIKKYEEDALERLIFTPLRKEGHQALVDQIAFYLGLSLGSEFSECLRSNGIIQKVPDFTTLHSSYNADIYDPKDGALIKICDTLAAFLETHNSIQTGVSSPKLVAAYVKMKNTLANNALASCLHLDSLMADFD